MNRPMPTEIAVSSRVGTARSTAFRNPVSTRIVMMMPSMTTRPMALADVMPGLAMPNATNALRPSPGGEREGEVRHDAHEDAHDAGHQGRRGGHHQLRTEERSWGYRAALHIDRADWDDPDYMFLALVGGDRPGRTCRDEPGEAVD